MSKRSHKLKNPWTANKWLIWLVLVFIVLLLLFAISRKASAPTELLQQEQPDTSKSDSAPKRISTIDLQRTINSWLAGQSATYSIVVYDVDAGKTIGSNLPENEYFAASLYKLYVAYVALIDIQNGKQNANQIIWGGKTRKQCIDLMIRESHSPCGEAMMASMGQQNLNERVQELGAKNTSFSGIKTSAADSALFLRFITNKEHLTSANTSFLLDAMRHQEQRFRNGLAKGALNAVWYTKVGWNETYNYHDVGIMAMPNGRRYVVAILSQDNGRSAPIADFASVIYKTLNK